MSDENEKRMVENYEITQEIRIGDREVVQSHCKNVCLDLESCCRICYIIGRKRESHRSGSTPLNE